MGADIVPTANPADSTKCPLQYVEKIGETAAPTASTRQPNQGENQAMNLQPASQPTPEQIAACAYLIWEKEGRPHGRHEAHWLQAEKQLKADCAQDAGTLGQPNIATPAAPPVVEPRRPARRNHSKRQEAVAA